MAELAPRDRLQPSLLDRLTDDDIGSQVESRETRVLSMRGLRRAVLRDLGWLLNAHSLPRQEVLQTCPLAARSVINYGIRDLTGITSSSIDIGTLEQMLRECLLQYEPRITPESLEVHALDGSALRPNQVSFEISGELWGQPLPERLFLKTDFDLELGEITVSDGDVRGT